MIWIVSSNREVSGTSEELTARLRFIHEVTGDESALWSRMMIGKKTTPFYCCSTKDCIDGVFVTAHNYDVERICTLKGIVDKDFVVANTCVWEKSYDKEILHKMLMKNQNVELWYAKQDPEVLYDSSFHFSNIIRNVGGFGFMTSKSERLLYKHRKKGLIEAIKCSFEKVSPVFRT